MSVFFSSSKNENQNQIDRMNSLADIVRPKVLNQRHFLWSTFRVPKTIRLKKEPTVLSLFEHTEGRATQSCSQHSLNSFDVHLGAIAHDIWEQRLPFYEIIEHRLSRCTARILMNLM